MKQKKTLLVLVLVFLLLLGAAGGLYTGLGEELAPNALAVQGNITIEEEEVPAAQEPETEEPAAEAEAEPKPEETPTASPEAPRVKAPDFTVYDPEGNEVRLSDFFGKPIVLNFWASWCGPCVMEMPYFQEKYLELGDEVTFLMVNATGGRETLRSAKKFIEENQYTLPVFYDTQRHAAMAFGAFSFPVTFFIDAEGFVVVYAPGALNGELLQMGIDMIRGPAV